MHLAIVAEGGPEIGFGHLVRTGALASECLRRGHDVTYLTRTPDTVDAVCPAAADTVGLSPRTTLDRSLDWLDTHRVDVALTDSYDADVSVQEAIHERVPVLAVVVNDDRHAIRADVVVNGNVYAPDIEYRWIGAEPEWCLGTDYLLLRDDVREKAREPAQFRETPRRALLTMGGSDVGNTIPVAMSAFDGLDIAVDVIVGPGSSNDAEITEAAQTIDAKVDIRVDPEDLVEQMWRADLAVSAFGSTAYELLALGTPVVGLIEAENQRPIGEALAERDAAVLLDDSPSPDAIREAVLGCLERPDRRRRMIDRGRALVDTDGTKRVYKALAAESASV